MNIQFKLYQIKLLREPLWIGHCHLFNACRVTWNTLTVSLSIFIYSGRPKYQYNAYDILLQCCFLTNYNCTASDIKVNHFTTLHYITESILLKYRQLWKLIINILDRLNFKESQHLNKLNNTFCSPRNIQHLIGKILLCFAIERAWISKYLATSQDKRIPGYYTNTWINEYLATIRTWINEYLATIRTHG